MLKLVFLSIKMLAIFLLIVINMAKPKLARIRKVSHASAPHLV